MRGVKSLVSVASILLMTADGAGAEPIVRKSNSPPFVMFAQAGSAGGTIGKQGKSASGGEEAAEPHGRKPPIRSRTNTDQSRDSTSHARQNLVASIAGSWDWEASCSSGQWQGGMTFRGVSATEFTGEFNKGHVGSLVGTAKGNRVSFVRDWHGFIKQQWTGTLSNSAGEKLRMQGPFTAPHHAGCRFSAIKN